MPAIQISTLKPFNMETRKAIPKKHFVSEEENNCEEETNLAPQDRIRNWCKCGCAKVPKGKGSILPFSFYGQLPNY